ncbi:uncharacterized protein LOC126906813 [Daktulosphaira vitifoliae]|uniref:uncharacterized protein LOC126906813 n=1 Tax=Daktulosphaira vitifoliae TaxID=58002 RepID=UPI0021A9F35E|nr:uncharacterized protein LOC126906813 [Daktulosphaira vitifoliae]
MQLIGILLLFVSTNFVISLNENEIIHRLNGILALKKLWKKFIIIMTVINFETYSIKDLYGNIDINKFDLTQAKIPEELLLVENLAVNQSNYRLKLNIIYGLINCKFIEIVKICNRLLFLILDEYITKKIAIMSENIDLNNEPIEKDYNAFDENGDFANKKSYKFHKYLKSLDFNGTKDNEECKKIYELLFKKSVCISDLVHFMIRVIISIGNLYNDEYYNTINGKNWLHYILIRVNYLQHSAKCLIKVIFSKK